MLKQNQTTTDFTHHHKHKQPTQQYDNTEENNIFVMIYHNFRISKYLGLYYFQFIIHNLQK